MSAPQRKRRYLIKRLALIMTGLSVLILIVGWLYMQHIPSWYEPLWMTQEQLDAVQIECEEIFDSVSSRMASGDDFTVSITFRQINEMLALQRQRWPSAPERLGLPLNTFFVARERESLRIGARASWKGIQSILSLRFVPRVAEGRLMITSPSCHAGSLRLPMAWLLSRAQSDGSRLRETESADSSWQGTIRGLLDQLYHGGEMAVADRFTWPNGNIDFELLDVALARDRITIQIRPLPH